MSAYSLPSNNSFMHPCKVKKLSVVAKVDSFLLTTLSNSPTTVISTLIVIEASIISTVCYFSYSFKRKMFFLPKNYGII